MAAMTCDDEDESSERECDEYRASGEADPYTGLPTCESCADVDLLK